MKISLKKLEEGICSIEGVKANGFEDDKYGLALIECAGKTVGVFTKNQIRAAPVKLTSNLLSNNKEIDNVIVNSGCANAFTGKKGYKDAEWMASLIDGETAVCSTGVIGKTIDREWIREKASMLQKNLLENHEGSLNAAKAIQTTDTIVKEFGVEVDGVRVAGIAKGSGMIEPRMGTMLSFIYTNADLSMKDLKKSLKKAVDKSFNMIVVDGDTSTNDTVLLASNESLQDFDKRAFQKSLELVCKKLAKMIARDGEGSTKFLEVTTKKARNKREAKSASKEILRSPLVKTMFFGESANVGRIVSALGNSDAYIEEKKLEIKINGEKIISDGRIVAAEPKIEELVSSNEIEVKINIGLGISEATAWGCDLSPDYVNINAGYY